MLGFLFTVLPGLAGKLLDHVAKRDDAQASLAKANIEGDVARKQALIQGYVEERKVIAQEKAAQMGSAWSAWMVPAAFGVSLFHYAAVVFCSVFKPPFTIATIPAPYDQLQLTIIWSVIGVAGVHGAISKILK